jgi:hypothetical protein
LYLQLFQGLHTTGDPEAAAKWTKRSLKLTQGLFRGLNFVVFADLHKPDLLDAVYLGIFSHLMTWLMAFLKKHKRKDIFNALWQTLPTYSGFALRNKKYSRVSQW